MTLKDKFQQWFINDEEDEHYEGMVDKVAIEHERIAEEFAIRFAEWVASTPYDEDLKLTDDILEKFKQKKGV